MELEGKVAIVTGAGRGIGRSAALALAREGASLILAARTEGEISAVADEVEALGRRGLPVPTDVGDEGSVQRMVDRAMAEFGTVDILILNAGIRRRYFIHELPPEELDAHLRVNLMGPFYCCRAVLPIMYDRKSGNIIFMVSRAGQEGFLGNGAYCASKFAQLGLMHSLAAESRAYGVRVNAICPTGAKTELSKSGKRADGTPIDWSGLMEPEEIADVVLFLASERSRSIHGQELNVYGGVNYHD